MTSIATIVWDLRCDGCGKRLIDPHLAGYVEMVGVIETAADMGWRHTDGVDLCDQCAHRLAALCDELTGGNDV